MAEGEVLDQVLLGELRHAVREGGRRQTDEVGGRGGFGAKGGRQEKGRGERGQQWDAPNGAEGDGGGVGHGFFFVLFRGALPLAFGATKRGGVAPGCLTMPVPAFCVKATGATSSLIRTFGSPARPQAEMMLLR